MTDTVVSYPDLHELELIEATPASLAGYGELVTDPHTHKIEIVKWPQPGWRALDAETGDEGGTTEGIFRFWWEGEVYKGRNEAVGGEYMMGWSTWPDQARTDTVDAKRDRVLLWHANYHPDGGQLFHPLDRTPFVAPLALPKGDDIRPQDFKAFWFDGSKGLYIHPSVWHEGIFISVPEARFFDKQGKVHARVSCDFPMEFDCYLNTPLAR